MKIDFTDLMRGTDPNNIQPGMTLNHVASRFRMPTGWTFPWTDPFGGSIEYGDLALGLVVRNRNIVVSSIGISLWDISFSDTDEPHRIPKERPTFKRNARINLQGIRGGASLQSIRDWISTNGFKFKEFANNSISEESWQVIANGNTLFSFCSTDDKYWLMDLVVFHKSNTLWPVKNGVGADVHASKSKC